MFVYRIYELDADGKVANRRDLPMDIEANEAVRQAQRLAVDCIVELWRGSNLLATFRPTGVTALAPVSADGTRRETAHLFENREGGNQMGLAAYDIVPNGSGWSIRHDDQLEGSCGTKEAAFEAALAAASLAIKQGHEIRVTAPGREAGNQTALGGPTN
jgi:hypothetical protein